jgi:hypothetical protein
MSLAIKIAADREKGFTEEQAKVIALMRVAAGVLFRDFPDAFLLYGGAPLVLFHDSVRQSADLDLLQRQETAPSNEDIRESLLKGLAQTADALNLSPLEIELSNKIYVRKLRGGLLFTVDISRLGSVLESEVVEYDVEIDETISATVKAPSGEFLLLHKAECFLLRKYFKPRDAFDIYLLSSKGIVLPERLEEHLDATLMNHEIEAPTIRERVVMLDEKRCGDLRSVIPPGLFESLGKEQFKPLRDAVCELYSRWL